MVRFKNRYVIVDITTSRGKKKSTIHPRDIYSMVIASMGNNFGDIGVGLMMHATQVIYYNATTQLAVVRCDRDYATQVQACLTFVGEFQHQDIKYQTIRICGSNRTCKDALRTISMHRIEKAKLDQTQPSLREDISRDIEMLEQKDY
ncbi:RNA-binding protein pop5 [Aphanomyces cochlioides]|nr:RNA-binding protein pop5 [Aphanomyces cochlioides]